MLYGLTWKHINNELRKWKLCANKHYATNFSKSNPTMQIPCRHHYFWKKKLTAILLQCAIVLVRGLAKVLQSQALVSETRKRKKKSQEKNNSRLSFTRSMSTCYTIYLLGVNRQVLVAYQLTRVPHNKKKTN